MKPRIAALPTVGHQLKRYAEAGRSFGEVSFRSALSALLLSSRPTDRPSDPTGFTVSKQFEYRPLGATTH